MNIFVLDDDAATAASYHCDSHVVKMILETAQLLCSAHHMLDCPTSDMYKLTHQNHPCAIWVRENISNYVWTYELFTALEAEYEYRYRKSHASWDKLWDTLACPPDGIALDDMTPFAQAMPEQYRNADAVKAYRAYYCDAKQHLLRYTRRDVPAWIH